MTKKWLAFSGISLLGFIAFLDFTVVNTALPVIQKELGMSVVSLQWILNIYFLVLACCMVVAGKLGDIYGHKKFFQAGGCAFFLGSLVAGVSFSGSSLIFGRFLQALGAALIFPLSASLLNEVFQEQKAKAFAIFGAIGGGGLAVGPVLGGILTHFISWRAIFFINLPLCLLGLFFNYFSLAKSKKNEKLKIDWVGFFVFLVGMACFVYGFIHSAEKGWSNFVTILSLLVGALALIAFFVIEKKMQSPLIDESLLNKPQLVIAIFSNMMGGIMSGLSLFYFPLFLHSILGLSILETGFCLFSITIVYTLFSTFVNRLTKVMHVTSAIILGMIAAVIAAIFFFPLSLTHSYAWIFVPCFFIGITWTIGNILAIVAAHEAVEQDKIGVATGMVYTLFNVGGSIVLAISVVIFKAIEGSYIEKALSSAGVHLSATEKEVLSSALADPTKAQNVLGHLGQGTEKVLFLFQEGFVKGLHGVAWLLIVVSLCITLITWTLKKRLKQRTP